MSGRGCAGERGERRRSSVRRDLLAPERHLLEAHEVRLGLLDLPRQRHGSLWEVGVLELVPDLARPVDGFRDAGSRDRGGQVRSEEEVAGHHRELRTAPLAVLVVCDRDGGHRSRQQRDDG
jgi:hypothetical protein